MTRRFLALALSSSLGAIAAPAQRTIHAPLVAQLPLGARSTALGGGNAATRDVEGALANPAGVGAFPGLGVNVVRYRDGAAGGVLGSTSSIGVIGVGIAVSYLDYAPRFTSPGPVSDAALVEGGSGTASSMSAAVAMSISWKGFRWGAAGTYLEERVSTQRSGVAAVSLGVMRGGWWRSSTLGLSLQNLGPSLEFGQTNVDLPARFSAGVSGMSFPINAWFDFTAEGGAWVRRDGLAGGNAGGELIYVPIEGLSFSFRGGGRRPELKAQGPITAGFGAALDRFALDYAWEQMREGGAHRIGLRVR